MQAVAADIVSTVAPMLTAAGHADVVKVCAVVTAASMVATESRTAAGEVSMLAAEVRAASAAFRTSLFGPAEEAQTKWFCSFDDNGLFCLDSLTMKF